MNKYITTLILIFAIVLLIMAIPARADVATEVDSRGKEAPKQSLEDTSEPNWCQWARRILVVDENDSSVSTGASGTSKKGKTGWVKKKRVSLSSTLLALAGCSEKDLTAEPGAVAFNVIWQDTSPRNCSATGIRTIQATAYSSSNAVLSSGSSWKCSDRSGTIYDVPSGSDIKLVVTGKNSAGNVLYRAEQTGIIVAAGKTTSVGNITAVPFSPTPTTPDHEASLIHGHVSFAWEGTSGTSSYRIQISKNSRFTSRTIDTTTTSASYNTVADLAAGNYFWRIQATDMYNNSSKWSPARNLMVDTLPPSNTTATNFINNGAASTNSATVSLAISATKHTGIVAYYLSESSPKPAATAPDWVTIAKTTSYSSNIPYILSSGDGKKEVYVWFKDTAGHISKDAHNTIILDTAPPETIITKQPANPTNATMADFSFASSEDGSTFQCSLDDGEYVACISPQSYTELTAGPHNFLVKATDAAGNIGITAASYNWGIDTTPPLASITSKPDPATNSTSANFSFSSSKTDSVFFCRLDSDAYEACNSQHSYVALTEGVHTIQVISTDTAGNADLVPVSYAWTIDVTPPHTSIMSALPANPTNSTSGRFIFSSSEAGSTFHCSFDGSAYETCVSPRTFSNLADGSHTFIVEAKDSVGNIDPIQAKHTWIVDTIQPFTMITTQPANPTKSTVAEFSFTTNKNDYTFQCALDEGDYATCNNPQSYPDLDAGQHSVHVKAIDEAGNIDPNPANYAWTIDITPPHTAITIRPAALTSATSANFTFSSTKEGSTFECRIDDGLYEVCANPHSYTALAAGLHTFAVKATDAIGNTDPDSASYSWTIDTTPPVTSITSQPSDLSTVSTASFSFISSKDGSTFQCQIDGGPFTACTSPQSYTGLEKDGRHTFTVQATDAIGNIDPTPARYSWAISLPPINATKSNFINKGGAAHLTQTNIIKLSISAIESDGKGVKGYYVSESPVAPHVSDPRWITFSIKKEFSRTVDYTLSSGNGKKTIFVWFKDDAGNISDVKSDTIHYYSSVPLMFVFLLLQVVAIL